MSQIHERTGVNGRHRRGALDDYEIELRELVGALWKQKYVIAAVAIGCGLLALASSYLFTRKYETALVFVTQSDDAMGGRGGGLGALASQFGGLASLGGFSLSGNERKAEYMAILQSQTLIERFITENNLMPVLYADVWDQAKNVWKDGDPKKQPTTWKAMQYFKSGVMQVSTNSKTGVSTISVSWSDAKIAARWANELVAMANEHVRAQTIAEAERNVAYLNDQLTKTSVVAVQNSISTLLENQIKRIMLAQGTDQYAFRVIDPALPPEWSSFPKRKIWAIVGSFIGLIGSASFVIFQRTGFRPGTGV